MKTPDAKAREFRKELENIFIEGISEENKIEVAFLAGYQEATRWLDVDEDLPQIGQEVLCKNKDYKQVVICDGMQKDYRWLKAFFTHWRPIE